MTYLISAAVALAGAVAFGSAQDTVDGFLIAVALWIWASITWRSSVTNQMHSVLLFQGVRALLTLDAMGGPAFKNAQDREMVREQDSKLDRDGARVPVLGSLICGVLLQTEGAAGFVYVALST
jgi:hypothetical protein